MDSFASGGLGGGGGVWRRDGVDDDVLTTCKAITLRGGQRIIAVFSQIKYFRSEKPVEGIIQQLKMGYICTFCFSRISYSYLSFGTDTAKRKRQSLQPCILNRQQHKARWTIDRVVCVGRGHQKIIEVMLMIKIPGG